VEHARISFSKRGQVISGVGEARSIGGAPISVTSSFERGVDDRVKFKSTQGESKMTGAARLVYGVVRFTYGPEGGDQSLVQEDLKWADGDTATGSVIVNGKTVATYTYRRIKPAATRVVLDGLDPVQLARGNRVEGRSDLAMTRGLWTYHFADKASRAVFEKSPAQFEVQFGGACMNMGPLTGRGAPNLFDTYKGKHYLFASGQCRDAFRSAPDAYLGQKTSDVKPAREDVQMGRQMLERAAEAHGGTRLDQLRSLLWVQRSSFVQNGKTVAFPNAWAFTADGKLAEYAAYNNVYYGAFWDGREGWQGTVTSIEPLDSQERTYLDGKFLRHPTFLLRMRKQPGFDVFKVGDNAVRVHYKGTTVTVNLDGSGRVASIEYPGRGLGPATLRREFLDWRVVDGVSVPFAWKIGATEVKFDQVLVNQSCDASLFRNPLKG
nr:hypothetical protein [Fimbriimonadaceae bacterium]